MRLPWRTCAQRRARTTSRQAQDGATLVELLVAMTIFTVVVAVFLSGVVTMTRTTVRAQNEADIATDLRRVYQQMDRQIRYADAANFPGVVATRTYVEVRATSVDGAAPVCTQWRVAPATGVQVRSWPEGSAPGASWRTLATTVVGPSNPFVLTSASVSSGRVRQSLGVELTAAKGVGDGRAEAQTSTVFVARNSSQSSPGNADTNGNGISATPVCGALSSIRS